MAQGRNIGANIAPFEVVFPATRIEVTRANAWDPREAQALVSIKGHGVGLSPGRGARVVRVVPATPLLPGAYELRVGDDIIPFFATDSVATVPSNARIYALSRVRVASDGVHRVAPGARPSGRYVEFMKGVHRRTGAPLALAFDQAGRQIDGEALIARLARARAKKLGKRDEALYDRVQQKDAREIPVAIWLRCDEALDLEAKPRRGRLHESPTIRRRRVAVAETTRAFIGDAAIARNARDGRPDRHAPVVYATLTRAELDRLEADDRVVGLFLVDREGIDDLGTSMAIANADDVQAQGTRGAGVNVAVWEDGPDRVNQLVIADRYTTSPTTSRHARLTHAVIRNREQSRPNGHAPAANVFSANSKDRDALSWAVDQGCTVISQSFHRRAEARGGGMSYDDVYKDWLALHIPYPTICQAAGNFWATDDDDIDPPENEFVNHKGFNGLVVGNHLDNAAVMSGDSTFRNPPSPHGDRELPEVSANGDGVTAVGLTISGTSFAAPAVAGGVALIQSRNTTLKFWPEACRAIVMAAATRRNISGRTWWRDVLAGTDATDGAGAHDAQEAWKIAQTPRNRNATPSRRGWDTGLLRTADLSNANGMSTFSYRVHTTLLGVNQRVSVVLAWNSRIFIDQFPIPRIESKLTVDLDLFVVDASGRPVAVSASNDNSYEIVEFDARPDTTYDIRIQRSSGTDDTNYGIAWTVFSTLILDPDVPPIFERGARRRRR